MNVTAQLQFETVDDVLQVNHDYRSKRLTNKTVDQSENNGISFPSTKAELYMFCLSNPSKHMEVKTSQR